MAQRSSGRGGQSRQRWRREAATGSRDPSDRQKQTAANIIGGTEPSKLPPGLYLVATPIGNARDITLRALDVLAAADLVACEDTRKTGALLAMHGVAASLGSYHEHNAERMRPVLVQRMAAGAAVALVSDAGTPLISDPGYKLVRDAVAAAIPVTTMPGPSAVLAALSVSALPPDRFLFAGFLPPRSPARRRALAGLAAIDATLVLLESARRLPAALADMAAVLGPRDAAVARELTKLHEEVRRAPLDDLAAHYAAAGAPRGEVVVVVAPPAADQPAAADDDVVDSRLREALREMRPAEAATAVAAATGLPRREVYARAVALKVRR